jgi:hypothetical protein
MIDPLEALAQHNFKKVSQTFDHGEALCSLAQPL